MKCSSLAFALLMLLCGSLREAYAAIAYYTFEGDAVGSVPAGWWNAPPWPAAYVSDMTAGEGLRSFYVEGYGSVHTGFAPQSSTELPYRLSSMARVEQEGVRIAPFTLLGHYNERFNDVFFFEDGTFWYQEWNGIVAGNYPTGVAYDADQWYSFESVVDLNTRRWAFKISDSAGNELCSRVNLLFSSGGAQYAPYFEYIRSLSFGPGGKWYIDNLKLEQIPEPSAILVWGVGAATILLLAPRRRKE